MRADDAQRIEVAYHKPLKTMTEAELKGAMQNLNVKTQELDDEFCEKCGRKL